MVLRRLSALLSAAALALGTMLVAAGPAAAAVREPALRIRNAGISMTRTKRMPLQWNLRNRGSNPWSGDSAGKDRARFRRKGNQVSSHQKNTARALEMPM